jgi:hypothetical protein
MKKYMIEIAGIIVGAILVIIILKRKEGSQSIVDGLFNRIFNRWTKWELDKADVPYIRTTYNPVAYGGNAIDERKVYFDVYVKTNKYNGIKKYKKVEKL